MVRPVRAWTRALVVMAAVIALDQVVKAIVRSSVERGDSIDVIPGVVRIVHVRNDGVAFGALSGGGALVTVVIVIALVALVGYFASHADRPLAWLPTGMLLGGALGNIIDRIRAGAVTDFIKFPSWPAFNVADICITFGVLLLLYVLERRSRHAVAHDA
jgi:signal peptidase II